MMSDENSVMIKIKSMSRWDKTIAEDIKEGYVYFSFQAVTEGKTLEVKKRLRIDKPEKMLAKFMSKLLPLVEQQYKEKKYFVADKKPPVNLQIKIINLSNVEEKMYLMLEEVAGFIKTGKFEVLVTDHLEI